MHFLNCLIVYNAFYIHFKEIHLVILSLSYFLEKYVYLDKDNCYNNLQSPNGTLLIAN